MKKNKKKQKNNYLIFLSFFLIIAIISSMFLIINLKDKYSGEYIKHTATLSNKECYKTNVDNNSPVVCDLFVNYKIDNKEYKNIKFNTFKSRSQIGEEIEIYYNKNKPEIVTNFDNIPLSLLSIIINLTIIITVILKNKKRRTKK